MGRVSAAIVIALAVSGCSFVVSAIRGAVESSSTGTTLVESQRVRGSTRGGPSGLRAITCGNASGSPMRSFAFVAPRSATYVFESATSDYDGVLAVWDPSAGELGCNDDYSSTRASQVTVTLRAGQAVEVVQGGYSGAAGGFEIWVNGGAAVAAPEPTEVGPPAPPQALAAGTSVQGDTRFRAPIPGIDCPPVGPMQEWTFTATEDGAQMFQVQADYDACLGVVPEGSATSMACNDDHGDVTRSQVVVDVVAGVTYRVIVGGLSGRSGTYTLTSTALATGGPITVGQPVFFSSGAASSQPDRCGAPAGSVDRTFTFRPPAEAFYAIQTDAPGWLVVSDGRRVLACVSLAGQRRAGLALKPGHRYEIVIELGASDGGAHFVSVERVAPEAPEWRGEAGAAPL
ncbi:hypothetical protein [Sandaracinus amylolyticus]|uniref:hypothetical protein n=1 Tax=Sandaracinus amylolyticus TaxID=927083 RepID=UPI001F28C637|nr:hypothetical protein [Sandaracinus amylolyticus]UJR86567.1 Hypothetical protein I5071_86680 [Sandaracinus amylolyticus]